jgi:hypothetical protein
MRLSELKHEDVFRVVGSIDQSMNEDGLIAVDFDGGDRTILLSPDTEVEAQRYRPSKIVWAKDTKKYKSPR